MQGVRHWRSLVEYFYKKSSHKSNIGTADVLTNCVCCAMFVIEMTGGKSYRIERRDQCGFTRHGSVQLYEVNDTWRSILNSIHIVRVKSYE